MALAAGLLAAPAGHAAASPTADGSGAAASEPAAVEVSVTPTTLWAAPEDGGDELTLTFTVVEPGLYEANILGDDVFLGSHYFGQLGPGTYSWSWDGRIHDGIYAPEQDAVVELTAWRVDHWAEDIRTDISVRRSADETWVSDDNAYDTATGRVDIERFTLTTAATGVYSRFDFFPRYRRSSLFNATAALDVSGLSKGYLASVRRRGSKLVPQLFLAYLASDEGRPRALRCPGMEVLHEKRTLTLRVPRKCMKLGGLDVRANAFVSGVRPTGYDGTGDEDFYWTDWVRYENPPF